MNEASEQLGQAQTTRGALLWTGRLVGHALGVILAGALLAVPFVDEQRLELFAEAAAHQGFWEMSRFDLLLFAGLSTCVWALVCILFALGREHLRTFRRGHLADKPYRLGARGSVMVETLIVLPVLLMLIGGISQLAVINIAGVFTNLATFQAGRSVWVWEREPCNTTGQCDAREMAKIQAASVLTPVAPGDFVFQNPDGSEEMEKMRGILVASQFPWPISDSGFVGRNTGRTLASSASSGMPTAEFTAAFDRSSFMMRTARKFTFAYHAVEVDFSEIQQDGRPAIEVELTYKQHCAFPFVQGLFGTRDTVAGRNGFYSHIKRTYIHVRQPEPNRTYPQLDNTASPPDRGGVRLF